MIDAPTAAPTGIDEAERLGVVPAGAGIRSLAFAVDAALWLALATPAVVGVVLLTGATPPPWPVVLVATGAAATTVFALVQLLTHGLRGVTAGKASMRLRSVSVRTLGRPGFWRVVLRAFVLWCSGIVPVIGPALMLASGLWDPQRRGRSILDRVGGCWLIDTRAGLDPFDAKARRHAERALRYADDGRHERLASMATGAPDGLALRIPGERSRAGVVGPDGTGARWQTTADAAALPLIDEVPVLVPAADSAPATWVDTTAVVEAAEPAPARRSGPAIRFDDGSVIRVPDAGLMGRNPEAAAGERIDASLNLDDPQMLMSKTHIAFGQDADGVWVVDRGSRNGTRLTDPGGAVVAAAPGERVRVPAGWAVHIGGRSFEVLSRGSDR